MAPTQKVSLDRLPRNLTARIFEIGSGQDQQNDSGPRLEDLLLGLGFEEGAVIEVRHQGPFGGPLAVNVDGRLVALRPSDAAAVVVELETQQPDLGS